MGFKTNHRAMSQARKFQNATIMQSQYCPGQDGVNDDNLGNYNAAGETFWWPLARNAGSSPATWCT